MPDTATAEFSFTREGYTMAVQVGNKQGPASSAMQPTPAPLVETKAAEQARSTSFGRTSYGANAFDGRVVNDPGQRTRAGLSVNNDDADPVLAAIRRGGAKAADGNDQTRPFTADQKVPTAFGHRSRRGDR
jgi:hypothetical protein